MTVRVFRAVVLSAALLVSGCSARAVHLYNPDTKATVTCQADPWSTWTPDSDNQACAKGYETQGFKRVD
jgi:hypothetical protein